MNETSITTETCEYVGTAHYSPEDNKIRVRPFARLDRAVYDRVKAAGFAWAPKQGLFVAPMWTPAREDLAEELCGEIGDEDTSLVERAGERAERFEGYQEKRADDADRAHAAVAAIADNIPLGQPILVGHHSEKRARKDAERIRSGMRKAVNLWKTSQYWERRAAGALRFAKYKENPAVRHRRIKGLEADRRKHLKSREESMVFLGGWTKEGLTREGALGLANYDHTHLWFELDREKITVEEAAARATAHHEGVIVCAERWVEHLDHRIAYERAMLADSGGVASDHFDIQVGGRAQCRDGWFVVKGVNRSSGSVTSVSLFGTYVRGIETVIGYEPPSAEDVAQVKAATKLPPIVNYPGVGFLDLTKAEWDRHVRCQRGTMRRAKATDEHGAYRYRDTYLPGGSFKCVQVFVTDAKVVERPKPEEAPSDTTGLAPRRSPRTSVPRPAPVPTVFDAMAESLRAGVTVVSAPQLFPTPDALADRMAEELDARAGHRVLEPSAGTGQLIRAVFRWSLAHRGPHEMTYPRVEAVEVSPALCGQLRRSFGNNEVWVHESDFLTLSPDVESLDRYDRVILNPPFAGGQDIAHIKHALTFVKPGGRLVAICANGPRQQAELRPLVEENGGTWEELPEGTFQSSGTGVRTVLMVVSGK